MFCRHCHLKRPSLFFFFLLIIDQGQVPGYYCSGDWNEMPVVLNQTPSQTQAPDQTLCN